MRGRTTKALGASIVLLAIGLGSAQPAAAAPSWKAPITVTPVRGIPDPVVGIDNSGLATIVYSDARPDADPPGDPVYAVWRRPGGLFSEPTRLGDGTHARIAVAPDGATAIAWADGDRIQVLIKPAPGGIWAPGGARRSVDAGGPGVSDLALEIDRNARATVVWKHETASDGPPETQLRAATVLADGTVGEVQELGPPAACRVLSVDANLAGDAVALCAPGDVIHIRPAGASLFATEPFDDLGAQSAGDATVDGAGAVTVATQIRLSLSWTAYRIRPRNGAFGPRRTFDDVATLFAQEDRTVAVWQDEQGFGYAIRPAGGEFGPHRQVRGSGDVGSGFAAVTAPLGPLPVMAGFDRYDEEFDPLRLGTFGVAANGAAVAAGEPVVPGKVDVLGNIAGNESGLAVFAWEQRCGAGWVVMAMVLDDSRGSYDPPCQDRLAPKAAAGPKRARLVGRKLRVRLGCDEACRIGVRVRVLRGGRGKPLATAKTRRAQWMEAERYRKFALRLTTAQAARVRAALAARRRVTVRLALSVRDSFENGAVRRVAVPLRR